MYYKAIITNGTKRGGEFCKSCECCRLESSGDDAGDSWPHVYLFGVSAPLSVRAGALPDAVPSSGFRRGAPGAEGGQHPHPVLRGYSG